MKKLLSLALVASLSACVTTPSIDLCKGAETRRTIYSTTIAAADVVIASNAAAGQPSPREVTLGRQTAATALVLLDAHCPRIAPASTLPAIY